MRVTGRGSSDKDVVAACEKLGDVTATVYRGDEATLRALPKPLIAHVEHDHFVAVVKADKTGVTYSCSDCGTWPGGRISLLWEQWRAMDTSEVLSIARRAPESKPNLLTALTGRIRPLFGFDAHSNAGITALAGGARSAIAGATTPVTLTGDHCGVDIGSLRCQKNPSCPMYEGGHGSGPSCHDPVNLSSMEEELSPETDLSIYNPTGPSVLWQRMYNSLRGHPFAVDDPETMLGTGWSHPYNAFVRMPGTGSDRYLVLPNGSRVAFTPDSNANGVCSCTLKSAGEPFRIFEVHERQIAASPNQVTGDTGVADDLGIIVIPVRYNWIICHTDGTVWYTERSMVLEAKDHTIVRVPGPNFFLNVIEDRNHNSIFIETDRSRILGDSGNKTLFRIRQSGPTGNILLNVQASKPDQNGKVTIVASDCYNRSVQYSRYGYGYGSVNAPTINYSLLADVSYMNRTDVRERYDYVNVPNTGLAPKCLSAITVPSPTGSGTRTAW